MRLSTAVPRAMELVLARVPARPTVQTPLCLVLLACCELRRSHWGVREGRRSVASSMLAARCLSYNQATGIVVLM
jgi:hypothetical protein